MRLKEVRLVNGWLIFNAVVVLACDAVVLLLLGPKGLAYLFASFVFSVGLHPLALAGSRSITWSIRRKKPTAITAR